MNNSYLEAGCGCVEITPPSGIPCLGFRPRHLPMTGVHDPLYVKAIVIGAPDGNRTAIIQMDGIGIDPRILGDGRNFIDEARQLVHDQAGIPRQHVMLASTHAHSTPETIGFRPIVETGGALEWLESVLAAIVSAVRIAIAHQERRILRTWSSPVEGVSANRRGSPVLDTELITLHFVSVQGDDELIVAHFACHPVIVQVQPLVSADFAGAMAEHVKRRLPAVREVVFLQGACADIDPACGNSLNWDDVERIGVRLGEAVVRHFEGVRRDKLPPQPATLHALSASQRLASRVLPQAGARLDLEARAERLRVECAARAGGGDRSGEALRELIEAEEQLWRIREGEAPYEAELQLIRIGHVLLFGLPFEPFAEMGLALKRAAREAGWLGIPVGFAGGYLGYIVPAHEWARGGYEVRLGPWSKAGPEAYDALLELLRHLLNQMPSVAP